MFKYIDTVSKNVSMVIFGGDVAATVTNEIWSYDLTAHTYDI